MPDFVAALAAAAVFCASLILLNGLTRLAMQWPIAPADLAENGLLQYGAALAMAGAHMAARPAPPGLASGQNRAGIVKV